MAARFSGSTNVPPPVATTAWRCGSSDQMTWRSTERKYGSPVTGENLRHRSPLARLDEQRRRLRRANRVGAPSACANVVFPAAMNPTR